jgi:eukaryotic-like serine/threonine-protein kinase
MANADLLPAIDDVLADKYRIERELGRGGMGIVVSATHLQLEERVAIKFLLPELAHDPTLVARFLREGRAAIKIRSEHVVRVRDVATLPGGTPYMVMEYLQGKDLEELLEEQGRLSAELAVDHVLQATEALAEAHALGMVHRDLKPANLFLAHRADGSPCVKVLDFGITKVTDTNDVANFDSTNASIVMGSPRYMSPEQMRSAREIDARADIWALGVILHELIAGTAPFDGATMPDLLAAILQDPPPPLRQHRPDAPQGLEAIIARCLEKDPAARYADVAELTEALAPFGSASARVSAERVSRVIRPRTASDGRTPAPIVRTTIPSVSDLRPDPASSAVTVTVSATATAWGATGAPTRSKLRTVGIAAGGLFFGATLTMAIFGGHSEHAAPAARASASAETPLIVAAPPVARENADPLESLDLTPVATSTPPADAPSPSASAPTKSPPVVPAKRRVAGSATDHGGSGLPVASAPSTTGEPDLFDGRK